jgi:hypothetical protein
MQSSMVVAGMDAERILRKHFDTSGKSAAQFHHRTICKTPMALSDNGFFGAIAGKKSLPTIEVAPARHSEGSPDRDRAGVHVTVVDVPTHLGSISRSAAGKSEHAPSIKAWPTPASNRIGVLRRIIRNIRFTSSSRSSPLDAFERAARCTDAAAPCTIRGG